MYCRCFFREDKRGGYSDHGYEKGNISCDDGDGRRNVSLANGDLRGDIRVDDGRRGSRYKETSQFTSQKGLTGTWVKAKGVKGGSAPAQETAADAGMRRRAQGRSAESCGWQVLATYR